MIAAPTVAHLAAAPSYPKPTIITKGDQFTEHGTVVRLQGLNVPAGQEPVIVTQLGAKFVRIRVNWSDVEPNGPADLDPATPTPAVIAIDQQVADYPPPAWTDYATTSDWWTDPSSLSDFEPFVRFMVTRYQQYPNVMGFEIWNEPHGAADTRADTAQVIAWEAKVNALVRSLDQYRAVVVMVRNAWDQGLQQANLNAFGPTRHLVLDVHDQFCGCLPGSASGYSADGESLLNPATGSTSSSSMVNANIEPYAGTLADQKAHLAYVLRWRKVLNRPILVGEFEVPADGYVDTNGAVAGNGSAFVEQMLQLFAQDKLSWAYWQGPGKWQLGAYQAGGGSLVLNAEGLDLQQALATG
jgi:Cellulase (glycosyl hydrolase family 5)